MQAGVDARHNLVVATHTINRNDRNALSHIAIEAKNNIEATEMTVLADKGYHNGKQIQTTQNASITTIVAQGELVNSNQHGTQPGYLVSKFSYNSQSDTYTCPQGQILTSTGKWHEKKRELKVSYQFKKYRTPGCINCPVKDKCTGRQDGRREIERSEYAESVEKNATNYKKNKELYRKRQEINEHIFGTIKRQWCFNHTHLRGLEKVNGEMALVMVVYNIRRSLNILTMPTIMEKLSKWQPNYAKATHFVIKLLILRPYKPFEFLAGKLPPKNNSSQRPNRHLLRLTIG